MPDHRREVIMSAAAVVWLSVVAAVVTTKSLSVERPVASGRR